MRCRAIVVDDQRPLAESLAERLALDGIESAVATSGAEAFGLCAGRIYDLAFVDLKLPDMSGVAVAEVMKKKLPNLFVVLMSGFAASIDDPELPRRWTDAILPKPWRPLELDAILRNFVGVAG